MRFWQLTRVVCPASAAVYGVDVNHRSTIFEFDPMSLAPATGNHFGGRRASISAPQSRNGWVLAVIFPGLKR